MIIVRAPSFTGSCSYSIFKLFYSVTDYSCKPARASWTDVIRTGQDRQSLRAPRFAIQTKAAHRYFSSWDSEYCYDSLVCIGGCLTVNSHVCHDLWCHPVAGLVVKICLALPIVYLALLLVVCCGGNPVHLLHLLRHLQLLLRLLILLMCLDLW